MFVSYVSAEAGERRPRALASQTSPGPSQRAHSTAVALRSASKAFRESRAPTTKMRVAR
jgi:hypothetical protein